MLTVLFATHNGGKTLPAVLAAYRKLDLPHEEWKLVIVDNGSVDETKEIIDAYLPFLPITYVFEPRRGKNAALNRGLSHIEGDLVVLSDDDVLPSAQWLREVRSAADTHPPYAIFGGAILPEWETPPEDWILSWVPLAPTYGILDDREDGPIEIYMVFGGNMAIRSEIFQTGYKWDETIGPRGPKYAQGGETELLMRLDQAGFKAWHCRKATVKHLIKSSQMDQEWILERSIRFGRGQYRLGRIGLEWKARVQGIPVRLCLKILKRIFLLGKARLSGNAESIFKEHWRLNYHLGIAQEARAMSRENRFSMPKR